ncbi:hypothetical protein GQ57_17790 [Burkholderia sp. MSh2]|uniref:Uncharacterized protein n=1 Tax=Burkholderia paludis TaxID=1506587 RepID=A0A6J5EDQ1_9BURK|nr:MULTISPECIES: hypothetical protein [Burkholderia]KEZ04478.1 hypothetical protein GQ57_17790 [Burkholderia sp. MSh2]CAB3764668.1 hypothetical protein LMG30113_04774 [Burkholderia paludis]VWC09596.1 hypothetical protein BPA30113_05155 [Burkholderia paludis]
MKRGTAHARRGVPAGVTLLLALAFALRALIPAGFMADPRPDADPFVLTLCSGHGPLVVSVLTLTGYPATGDASRAGARAAPAAARPDTRGTPRHDAPSAPPVCPFSAVLSIALVGAAASLVLVRRLVRPAGATPAPAATPVLPSIRACRHARAPPA